MPAVSAVKTGIGGAVYRNSATYATPTWVLVALVRDVTDSSAWDTGETSTRGSRAKTYAKTQVDIPHQITMRADDADAQYVAFFDAWASPLAVLDLMILDGVIANEGAMGVRAEFLIKDRPQNQDIGGIIYTSFNVLPIWSASGPPKSVKMGAALAPAFTSF